MHAIVLIVFIFLAMNYYFNARLGSQPEYWLVINNGCVQAYNIGYCHLLS